MKNLECPQCKSQRTIKNGRDFRLSDSKYVQKFLCKNCQKHFSTATFSLNKYQNKRRLNNPIYKLFIRGVSISNIASFLNTTTTTVVRKLIVIAEQKDLENRKLLNKMKGKVNQLVFDELLTHEHTKCKPLSVSIAVEKGTGIVLGIRVVKSPATGKLAAISLRKYGPRPNEEKQGIEDLFNDIIPYLEDGVLVESDKKTMYKSVVREKLTAAKIKHVHLRYKGAKNKERGQGEMINHAKERDPLFWINHTFAKLRYGVSRLIRKTWCNTKKQENLVAQIKIWVYYNNEMMLKRKKLNEK